MQPDTFLYRGRCPHAAVWLLSEQHRRSIPFTCPDGCDIWLLPDVPYEEPTGG